MIVHKLHKRGEDLVLAACDEDLIGKTLITKDGAEVFINPKFYRGRKVNAEELLVLLKEATIANLFGSETLKAVHSFKLRTILVQGVPHAQIFKMI